MNITISGGAGFVGRRLVQRLLASDHSLHLLIRRGKTAISSQVVYSIWDAAETNPPAGSLAGADAIIHLAGEPVAQCWTPSAKRRIRGSRVEGTERLVQVLATLDRRPSVLICASAVGYYGSCGDEELAETSPPGAGFLSEVCVEWERASRCAEAMGVRVVNLRIGVVLGPEGGMLAKVLPIFRIGGGGRLGSGTQWMSWIHAEDLVSLIVFALKNDGLRGPVNATAPNPVRNSAFTQTLAAALRRPAIVPVPAFALRMLFGEMAEVMLGGQRVVPRVAESAGFRFEYPDLKQALDSLLP